MCLECVHAASITAGAAATVLPVLWYRLRSPKQPTKEKTHEEAPQAQTNEAR